MIQLLLDENGRCANCGTRCILVEGQMICPSCGLIADRDSIAVEIVPVNKSNFARNNMGCSIKSKLNSKRNKSLSKILDISRRLGTRLNLPQIVLDMSLSRYIKVREDLKSRRITHVSLFAAAIMSCARSVGHMLSFTELYNAFEEIGYPIKQKEMLRALSLLKNSGLYTPPADTENLVISIVGRLLDEGELNNYLHKGSPASQFIVLRANDFLRSIGYESLVGKNPRVLASAAVYAAIRQLAQSASVKKFYITQKKIAELSGVAEYSVRDCYSRMFSPLVSVFEEGYLKGSEKTNTSSVVCQEYAGH